MTQTTEETTTTSSTPAPSVSRIRGLAIGRVRTVPLIAELRDKGKDETDEAYASFRKIFEPYLHIKITVRHQSRKKVQLWQLKLGASRIGAEQFDPQKVQEQQDQAAAFLLDPVIDMTGKDLGPVLVGVEGIEMEQLDGSILDSKSVQDPIALVGLLEEVHALSMAVGAALNAQEPTRVQGN